MNVARAYEARCDMLYEAREARNDALDHEQMLIDEAVERIEQSKERLASAIDDNSDPEVLMPILAEIRMSIAARQRGNREAISRFEQALSLLDQHIYDCASSHAQREVRARL